MSSSAVCKNIISSILNMICRRYKCYLNNENIYVNLQKVYMVCTEVWNTH